MINQKTPTGISFFDHLYGGVYKGRATLITGRSGSGKSIAAMQFLRQGLRLQERCLLLSTRPAEDVALQASALDMTTDTHIESGNLIVLEYSEAVPGGDRNQNIMLPPEGFPQLQQIIESHAIQRVALDTVLPWVTLPDPDRLPIHVLSMVRAFQRLGTTTLFTMPRPVSSIAVRLRSCIEDVVPISISLITTPNSQQREWMVNKYLGGQPGTTALSYRIEQPNGIVEGAAPTTPVFASGRERETPPAPRGSGDTGRIRFATVMDPSSTGTPQTQSQSGVWWKQLNNDQT